MRARRRFSPTARQVGAATKGDWRMPVRFFYVDESYDNECFCLSAISIRHSDWDRCFELVRAHRKSLKQRYGIYIRKEVHARDFVAGRGKIADRIITKFERVQIFKSLLTLVAELPGVQLFNVCLPQRGERDITMKAWDRLTNRIERTMREMESQELPRREQYSGTLQALSEALPDDVSAQFSSEISKRLNIYRARAFILADEGREHEITSALRRMRIHNPIPSRYGEWQPGVHTTNIPTQHIIEDPVFKPSHRSYFIQLADCVAFALLKRETVLTERVRKYGIQNAFVEILARACFSKASKNDPRGIVRK
jgi:hypothetical protein